MVLTVNYLTEKDQASTEVVTHFYIPDCQEVASHSGNPGDAEDVLL